MMLLASWWSPIFTRFFFTVSDERVGHVRNDQILPNRQPHRAGAVVLRDIRETAHLLRLHRADGDDRADVVAVRLLLFVRRRCARAGSAAAARWQSASGELDEREGELLLDLLHELLGAPLIDEILQPRLLAIRAIAVLVEDANDRRATATASPGFMITPTSFANCS